MSSGLNGNETHEMELVSTHPSGAEEWHCPTCGRRFLMSWPPDYRKIVLEPGDEYAQHSGGKGGLSIGGLAVTPPGQSSDSKDKDPKTELSDEMRRWLNDAGFDSWWAS